MGAAELTSHGQFARIIAANVVANPLGGNWLSFGKSSLGIPFMRGKVNEPRIRSHLQEPRV
jgi:hypothetical protein